MLGNELSGHKRGSVYWVSFIKHVLHIWLCWLLYRLLPLWKVLLSLLAHLHDLFYVAFIFVIELESLLNTCWLLSLLVSSGQQPRQVSLTPSCHHCMAQDRMGHLHCPGFGEGLGARQPFWLIHACVTNIWVVMGWEYLSALTIILSLVCRNSSHLASMWSTGWSRPLNSKP